MKTQFINALLLFPLVVASQNIQPLSSYGSLADESGVYYKDLNNELDPFQGTYVLNDNNRYFKVVLQKQVHSSANDIYFEDMIIGEFQYIENGEEKVNSLASMNPPISDGRHHTINTHFVVPYGHQWCEGCQPGEKALYILFGDPASVNSGIMIIRKTAVAGQEAIVLSLEWEMDMLHDASVWTPASIPIGTYTLLKQP